MRSSRRRRRRRALAGLVPAWLVAVTVGCAGGWAYTAGNAVAGGGAAGQGSAAINPYTIGSVAYTLNVNSPQNIDAVTFTLSPAAANAAKAQLVTGGSWYSCVNSTGNVACATTAPQASATTANNLTIVAAQ